MMKTTENALQKIQEILEALVINERYYLITCIKNYHDNYLTDNEIFNLSIQPNRRAEQPLLYSQKKSQKKSLKMN